MDSNGLEWTRMAQHVPIIAKDLVVDVLNKSSRDSCMCEILEKQEHEGVGAEPSASDIC